MHGLFLVDKPEGITSNELVRIVKKRVRPARVGHTGTLDSPASGLMVILIGAGTRTLDYLDEARKTYLMTVVLGEETDTGDRQGTLLRKEEVTGITQEAIEDSLTRFRGIIDQVPPHFSALKREGIALHKLARKGVFPELAPRKVEIFFLEIREWESPILELEMVCSKGTYARAIARDLGRALGVGGRIEKLRRTTSGPFSVENAISVPELRDLDAEAIAARLVSLSQALEHIPDFRALPSEVKKLMRGAGVAVPRNRLLGPHPETDAAPRLFKIASANGDLIVLVRPEPRGVELYLQPVRVFNAWGETTEI